MQQRKQKLADQALDEGRAGSELNISGLQDKQKLTFAELKELFR